MLVSFSQDVRFYKNQFKCDNKQLAFQVRMKNSEKIKNKKYYIFLCNDKQVILFTCSLMYNTKYPQFSKGPATPHWLTTGAIDTITK